MSTRFALQLRTRLECDVCLQKLDGAKAREHEIEDRLFGSVAFALCPCCGQKAPNLTASAYLLRAARWVQRRSLDALQEKLGPCRGDGRGPCSFAECPQRKVELVLCPLANLGGEGAGT